MNAPDARTRVLGLLRRQGLISAEEATRDGIHSQVLSRLVREGVLERVSRGLYRVAGQPVSAHHGLVLAATAVPEGVICLLSALNFHDIGTQLPAEVWMALGRRVHRPQISYPPLRIVRHTGEALTAGIEIHDIEGRPVRVYNVGKTLADCFKYRNKIGLDVALEALNDAWRKRRFTIDEINRYARICRVQRVMTPYLESLLA